MRSWILVTLTAAVSGALTLLTGEILVRCVAPTPMVAPLPPPSVIHEPDPVLGWRNKQGRYVWPGRGLDRGRDIVMTFWADGLRATAPARVAGRPEIVIVGGSLTQGWAVSDEETFPWRLQAAFPDLEILNLGTAGYGTYQSLLALERFLAQRPTNLVLVIYGLIQHHAVRNVAPAPWLRAVSTSGFGRARVPFATLAPDGTLVRHEPEAYPDWPFARHLASVRFLEERYAVLRTGRRSGQRRAVTDALVRAMARVSRAHGASLLVAVLHTFDAEARDHYTRVPESLGIATVDCVLPDVNDRSRKVPGYGHPNRVANAEWAACIARKLRSVGFGT